MVSHCMTADQAQMLLDMYTQAGSRKSDMSGARVGPRARLSSQTSIAVRTTAHAIAGGVRFQTPSHREDTIRRIVRALAEQLDIDPEEAWMSYLALGRNKVPV